MENLARRIVRSLGWWDALGRGGQVRLLALNSLVGAMGTGLAAVCLPFFAVGVAGLRPAQVGLILSVAGICELVATVPNGALAGLFGIQRFNICTKLIQAMMFCLLALSHGVAATLSAMLVIGVARAGNGGLNQSLTAAVLDDSDRSAALGVMRALRNVGFLGSSAIAALLLSFTGAGVLRAALVANGFSFVFGAVCVSRLRTAKSPKRPRGVNWSVLRDGRYLGLALAAAMFSSSIVVLDVGLPLWVLRHHNVPRQMVAIAVMVNTLLVVLFQYRFSKSDRSVPDALRAIRLSSLAFLVTAIAVAASAGTPAVVSCLLLLCAAGALTLGELLESPSWWSISYLLAPQDKRNEYLAAFDLNYAMVSIAGPAAMAFIVSAGVAGWCGYGVAVVAAGLIASRLAAVSRTDRQHAELGADSC